MFLTHSSASRISRLIVQGRRWQTQRGAQHQQPLSTASDAVGSDDDVVVDNDVDEHHDYFRLLQVGRQFDLSNSQLKHNYRKLMAEYHPDKHTQAMATSRRESIEKMASEITNAYEVLSEPQTRAMHMLGLAGHPISEAAQGELVGNEFLMSIMEVREDIESTAPTNMKPLLSEADSNIDRISGNIKEAFDKDDYPAATKYTAQLKYWCRIKEAVKDKMEDD